VGGRDVEFAVVGAGVLGLSAAHCLVRRGHQVVVCEATTVGHRGSGSKGSARIFRLGYDDPGYVRLAMVAHRLWRRLEDTSDTAIVTTTGQVTFGHHLDVLVDAMTEAGAPHQLMGAAQVAERFPALSVSGPAVFEPESGVIAAHDCLNALRRTAGLELREGTRMLRCHDDGDGVRLVVAVGEAVEEIRASVVLVCAGPWTASLVSHGVGGLVALPTLEQVAYLAPAGGPSSSPVDALPVFVERGRPWFYGLPDRSEGLMKISLHGAGPAVNLDALEDGSAFDEPDAALVAELSASARRVLPGLDPEPVSTERCVYDNAADGDFVLDRIGNVVVGAGTSGHGFKFAPLMGEVLADLATGARHDRELGPASDLERFAVGRLRGRRWAGGPAIHR
jgi:sarcosine oxidase